MEEQGQLPEAAFPWFSGNPASVLSYCPAAGEHLFPEGPALCQQQVVPCALGGREAAGGSSDVCLRQDAASLLMARW